MIHVLYLDDEEHNLTAFRAAFRRDFNVYVTTSASEAERLIQEHPIEVIISDQKMPDVSGVEFLELMMKNHPDPVRMLLTGHADIDAVIDAINKGRIYKYISKPWNEAELRRLVEEASDIYRARKRNKAVSENYGRNLQAIRAALVDLRSECEAHSGLDGAEKARWSDTLSRMIGWIENPESDFHEGT
jgi:response regulator RpfG family c-di-GMP phosphodiesterase